jgi:hypothetical protein
MRWHETPKWVAVVESPQIEIIAHHDNTENIRFGTYTVPPGKSAVLPLNTAYVESTAEDQQLFCFRTVL